jgi:hypothetical protein
VHPKSTSVDFLVQGSEQVHYGDLDIYHPPHQSTPAAILAVREDHSQSNGITPLGVKNTTVNIDPATTLSTIVSSSRVGKDGPPLY